jgi:mRNA interferase MazF
MIDKTLTVRKDKVGLTEGRLERETMLEIERRLALFLGIAK